MRMKKEYIGLAVVIVALCLVLILKKGDRTHYRLPELAPVSAKQITKLIVAGADSALTIERQGDLWRIAPYGFPADTSQVNRMINAVAGFTITELVSEAGNYVPYELDEGKRIAVEAFEGDRSLLKFSIGKPAPTYSHTFVLLENDPRIYQARENLRSELGKDMEQLRDKVVLTVPKDGIDGVTLVSKGDSLTLQQVSGGSGAVPPAPADTGIVAPGPLWLTADGKAVDERAIEGILDRLVSLRCDGFIKGRVKGDFKDPVFTIRVDGAESAFLSVYDKGEDAKYPAVSSESEYPFYLGEWTIKQIMKKPDELLEKARGS